MARVQILRLFDRADAPSLKIWHRFYLCIFVTKTQEHFMNPNNPFAGLKNKPVPVKPSHAGENVDGVVLPSKAPLRESRVGRPKEGRPKRVVAFTSDELYAWIER